jgi:lipopolysaccharide assembly outer membrane protein LptD (OstA)
LRWTWFASVAVVLVLGSARCWGQASPGNDLGDPENDNLIMKASSARTWADGATNVVMLEGPVRIDLDRTKMTADRAVVWIAPLKGGLLEEQRAEIALLGNVTVDQQGQVQRSGDRLLVTATVRGVIRVTAGRREVGKAEQSELYQEAKALRPLEATATGEEIENWAATPTTRAATGPATTQATSQPSRRTPQPVIFSADKEVSVTTSDGTVALVVTGNVKLFQRRGLAESIEMQADRAVLFTPLHSLKEVSTSERYTKVEEAIVAAYLEGDVRIVHSPGRAKAADQRMVAARVYYDFETDRAVLTDAVLHTVEPLRNIPVIVRAQTLRQLSQGEYRAEKVKLTQSSFFTPSYDIGMKQAYIRQVETGDPQLGTLTNFVGKGVTYDLQGTPLFWWPVIGGTFTERGGILRNLEFTSGKKYGTGMKTELGLFELLGKLPPEDVDASLSLDYFHERGPAVGLNGKYAGGFVTEQTKQPWAFEGHYETYVVNDHGEDDLGRKRLDVEPDQNLRYRVVWEHQHFFPDNWQVQLTGALISDATFQEEWFRSDFERQRPLDTAIYLKHQDQSEAFTLLYSIQPNDFVTAGTAMQEQAEVERTPEVGYHLIGKSLGEEGLTFFSDNTAGGYRFQGSNAPIFVTATPDADVKDLVRRREGFRASDSPGLPSYGRTGTPTRVTYRGDFRQEVDYPFSVGQFRVVPYVMGRYTWYSQSPDPNESSNDRLFAGAGLRMTTAFWKVDDSFKSEIFDLHRLRHVVEPELNVFTSAQSISREHLYQYDEPIDEINDISAVQIALHQRWQTKRGGAGRWRSVDFFSLNVEGNFFANKPPDDELAPVAFRGLYYSTLPEASLARNSINADATWRVSDTTAILSDAQYSLDDSTLATASIGLAAARDERLGYFIGLRYIDSGTYTPITAAGTPLAKDLHSVVLTGAINYELTPKYTISARQSFDFGTSEKVLSDYTIIRHFDRWYAAITFRVDYIGEDSGVFFNVWPEGIVPSATSSSRLSQVFQ